MSAADDLAAAAAALPGLEWAATGPQELPPLRPPALPLGPLRRALRRARRPVLVVNDGARVTLDVLPALLAELWEEAGQPPIVVATGTHRGDLARERDRLGGLPVELHDADDAPAHIALDETGRVRLDRRVARADLVVAFGVVEPHYFAGWSGAHKTATVGVWDRATTAANHEHALSPGSRPLVLEGNPVFDDLATAARALEEDRRLLAVNHVLDGRGRALAVGVGTWRGSLRRCLLASGRRYVREVPAPADVVVARVRGPLAASLYQADKGIKNCEAAVRDGGALVLAADCRQGVGPDRFVELLRRAPDAEAARAVVADEGYVLGDHKAVRWRALEARGVRIRVASPGLSAEALAAAGVTVDPDLASALAAVGAAAGRGLVVDDAGLVVCRPAAGA